MDAKLNKKKSKKTLVLMFGFISILTVAIALNTNAEPSFDDFGCHVKGDYTISTDVSEIQAEKSSICIIEVIATGTDVVIDIDDEGEDNALFSISPGTLITDNSADDLDDAPNSIRVELEITMPAVDGEYVLRIMSRGPLAGIGTLMDGVDIPITVGIVIKTPVELFFDHQQPYLGGIALIMAFASLVVFQINLKRESESVSHGIIMAISLGLTALNVYLILGDAIDFSMESFGSTEVMDIGQFNHIILGSIGFVTGAIMVFGSFAKLPENKLKLVTYLTVLIFSFNFLNGIFLISPIFGAGG